MKLKKTWRVATHVLKGYKGALFIMLLMLVFLASATYQTGVHVEKKHKQIVEEAIKQGVVQCYATEGIYPPDIDYLKTYYGLQVDEAKYIVHYESFASNIYPTITVIEKRWGSTYEKAE